MSKHGQISNPGTGDDQWPKWMQDVLKLHGDFVLFQRPIDESEEASERFVSRCREATQVALAIAKLRHQRAQVGFVPLPLGDYLRGLAKSVEVKLSRICEYVGIADIDHLDVTSAGNWARLARQIGFSLKEVLLHVRVSFAEHTEGVPITVLVSRQRSSRTGKNTFEQCEVVLGQIEKEYDPHELAELRHIEAGFRAAYKKTNGALG